MEIKMTQKLGKGAFGEIFLGTVATTGQTVAIKVEPI